MNDAIAQRRRAHRRRWRKIEQRARLVRAQMWLACALMFGLALIVLTALLRTTEAIDVPPDWIVCSAIALVAGFILAQSQISRKIRRLTRRIGD